VSEEHKSNSVVEINFGENRVRVEASEEFITEELKSILEWTTQTIEQVEIEEETEEETDSRHERAEQTSLVEVTEESTEEVEDQDEKTEAELENGADELAEIAQSLNVDEEKLSSYFYMDGEGTHIKDPLEIDPKYAFLGYCLIEKERTGDPYRDNRRTKEVLIDREMIDINRWGSTFLYRLRNDDLIKDDPNSDKGRNRPFKITPKGHREFVNWLQKEE
jgi:hypothetical protein